MINAENQVIMHIKAGKLPATDMLKFLLAKEPNAVGFMVQEPNSEPLVMLQEDASNLELAQVEQFLANSISRPKSMYFGKLADGYNPEDIQPYYVEDGNNQKLIGVMFEGDVSQVFDDKTHTEQYNYVHNIVFPKLVQFCETFDGDIKEVMKQFERDSFKNALLAGIGHRAVLHVMPHVGEPVMISKNQLFKPFDWGWVSHAEGYGVKAPEATVVKPKAGYGWGGNKQPAKANANKPTLSVVKDAATPGTAPRASVPSTPKVEKSIAETMYVRPPSWLHKNDDVKLFYTILTGSVPSTWKKKTPVQPTQNLEFLKVTNYDDFKKYQMERLMGTTTSTQTKTERLSSTATPGVVPEQPATLPADMPIHGPVDPSPLPIIEADKLQQVLDYVAEYLGTNGKEMQDPSTLQEVEKKIHPFTEQVGLKGLEETMNWSVSGLFGLAAVDPRAMVMYALQWRSYARQFLLAELKAKKKDGVPMTTETKTTQLTSGTTKVESVVKPAAKKAASGWGYGKKVA